MQALRIEARPITPDDQIRRNMDYALSLGLPEADGGPLKHLTVVANGPSARHLPLWPEGDTLALNGALKLFRTKGVSPTYWAGCDPQPMVADFLDDPPDSTIYFVASKCDKAVFDALRGRDVRLWHIADYPPPEPLRAVTCASSVTLVAIALFRKLGYRAFDVWGWDACYVDGLHHATPQPHIPVHDITVMIGAKRVGETFEGGTPYLTTSTWAAEARDAVIQLHHADYNVTIHGDGMVKAMIGQKCD